jgi:hypothetical protein
MKYQRTYRRAHPPRESVLPAVGTLVAISAVLGLFAFAVAEFRDRDATAEPEAPVSSPIPPVSAPAVASIRGEEKAELHSVRGDASAGIATRRMEDGQFVHTIKANLPTIDRQVLAYQGWLVRPAPYDYFATGEMVTNDLGEFVVEFKGDPRGEYAPYTQVIVTLEPKDGNPDPSDHVLEGEFE